MDDQQPLSGDIQGMASSHPMNPNTPAPIPKAKAGRAPAAAPNWLDAPDDNNQAPDQAAPVADNTDQDQQAADQQQQSADSQQAANQPQGTSWLDSPDEAPKMPDKAQLQNIVSTNLKAHRAQQTEPTPGEIQPSGFMHDLLGGLGVGAQSSVLGLAARGKMPDTILPEHADMAMRIGSMVGQFAGDLPAMVAGMIGGAAAGTVEAPVVGTIGFGAAGAFAAPPAIRKALMDYYTRNPNPDKRDFVASLMATAWEGIKGGTTGVASSVTGGLVAPVAGKLASAGAELAAMTTVGSALEGHLPHAQDFIDGAIMMGGLHAIGHITGIGQPKPEEKLRNVFAATNETPAEIINNAAKDVELKQQLVAGNAQEPEQATPTKLEHDTATETKVEGEKPEVIGTDTKLVPKDDTDMGLNDPPGKDPVMPAGDEEKEVLSKIGVKGDKPSTTWKQTFDDFYARNVDYLDPLHSAIEEAKRKGADISESAYDLGRVLAAHMDKVRSFLEFGTRDGYDGKINGEGLNAIMKDIPDGDMNGYRAYAMAKRALELQGRGINPWDNFNEESAQKVVDTGVGRFEEINQRRIDFSNRVLDFAKSKGLFDHDQIEAMKEANKSYIPFNRAFEANEITGTVKGGSAIREIFGSDKSIVDPILQTYKNTEMIMKKALINEVRATFVDNLNEGGLIGLGKEGEDLSGKYLNKVKGSRPVFDNAGGVVASITRPLGDNQIAVFRNGVREVYEGTPGVIDSLQRLDGDSTALDITAKVLRGFSNATRIGVVSNPAFGFAHFFRSQIMSSVYSKTGMLPFQSLFSLGEFMQGNSEAYQNWLFDGGATGSLFKLDDNYLKDNEVYAANKDAPFIGRAWNAIKKPFEASEAFIKLTDNLSRFTEYKRSIEAGIDPLESAMRSRDVVPDYAKVGLQRSVLRTGVAFIGAHINSLDRMVEAFTEDPKGTTMKMAVISGMSAALWAINKDDDAINAIPDWQKNTYWNFNISRFSPNYQGPQDATILRLPKPWAPGIVFGSGAEVALDAFFKNGEHPKELQHFSESFMKSVLPELMPNMLQPIMDQYSNKQAFTGRPLVSADKEKLLPEMQYGPYTSETAKVLGRMIGYVPLVRDIGPSTDPLASPAVVENYIKVWGGTIGAWALKASDWDGRGFQPSTKPEPWENTPFIHSFLSRYPSWQDQRIQDFYENKDDADKAFNSAKVAMKMGDFDAAQRIQNAHPDFQVRLNTIAKGISTARRAYENIQDNTNIPALEKRQLLDSMLFQIGSMAKEGNKMMSDFRRNVGQTNTNNSQAVGDQ